METLPGHLPFREVQRFSQPWLWVIILVITGVTWWAVIQQLLMGKPFGTSPGPNWLVMVFLGVLGFGFPWFFIVLRLETGIGEEGVYARFFPFHLSPKVFKWDEIAAVEAVTYRPILDYGGWGIRYGRKGRAYNVKGNRGIYITFMNGKRLMIGSQVPEKMLEIAASYSGAMGKILHREINT